MSRKKLFFNKRSKLTFVEAMVLTCGCMLVGVPLLGSGFGDGNSYYEVTLEGKVVGSVRNPGVVENAFLEARARISRETEGLVLADVEYELDKVPKIFGSTMDPETLTEAIYQELQNVVATAKKKAYQLKINEFTVTLGGYQDVMDVLYAAKNRYDTENEFQISIVSDAERELNVYTVDVSRQQTEETMEQAKPTGIAAVPGTSAGIGDFDVSHAVEDVITETVTQEDVENAGKEEDDLTEVTEDGLRDVDFTEKVEIAEAYVSADQITPTDEAIEMVTKETAKNTVYEVQPGDTLSVIANSNGLYVADVLALNEGLSESTVLHPGDQIIITVPEPELTVTTVEEATYEEDYFAEVQYIDNDEWYTTDTVVRQEPVAGHHEVTALITSENLRELYGHTLPANEARLKEKIALYRKEGYSALISGKVGNKCTVKITKEAGEYLVALKRSRVPVRTDAQIFTEYNRVAAERGWKPLKSIRFAAEEAVWMIAAASIGDDVQPRAIRKSWTLVRNYPAPPPVDAAELAARPQTGTPRNIIMIIGDGMGQGAQRLASLHAHGEPGRLVMEQLPAAGLALTHSANNSVTDSAASGTALSSGYKTNNGMVGVAPDKSKRNSIAEAARDSGRSVGIITTDSLTGATPGAYLAHVEHRGMTEAIADFASKSGFDILTGSDAGPFLPRNAGGKRGDGRDIFAELRQAGYREANDPATLSGLPAGKVYGTVNNWLSDTELLSKYAAAAFERLNANPRGFFVMVECSYPDYGGHGNNPELSTQGVLMADFLVRAALDFAGKRNDTLVVVTADHETGGISAAPNRGNPKRPFLYYTTTNHTGTPVAIFACGPGANRFAGVLDNTDIPTTLAGLWNLRIGEKISE